MTLPPPLLRILATCLLVTAISACGGKTVDEHFQQGKELLAKGDRRAAIIELKTVLQTQPANAEARLLLGKAYLEDGAYADAAKELTQAREKGAPEKSVLPLLAKTMVAQGQFQETIDLGIPSQKFDPQSRAALHIARASAQLNLGNQKDADQSISSAEEADPNHPDLLLLKAKLALSKQDKLQAVEFLDSILRSENHNIDALALKADLLEQAGQIDEALGLYERIVTNDATKYRAHLAIANLLVKKNQLEGADKALQAAERVGGKDPLVKYARGTFELQRGKHDIASSNLLEVLRVMPNHLPSMQAYALASYGQEHYDQSINFASKVLGALPGNTIAAKVLAASQLRLGDHQSALKTLGPFVDMHTKDIQLLALTGEAHLQAKDYNKAMGYLDRAAKLAPEDPTARTRLAAGQLAAGNSTEAVHGFEQAAALSTKPGQADLALVIIHLNSRQYDKALEAIANVEKKLSPNPLTHNLRAAALLGKHDKAGARKALEQALKIQPNYYPAAYNLARLDIKDRNPKAARKRLETVLAVDKDNLNAMLALADLSAAEEKIPDSLAWLERARQAQPQDLAAAQRLIQHYLGNKDNRKAITIAKDAVSNNLDSPEAMDLLGTTQFIAGDLNGAIETFTRLANNTRNSPEAHLRLARVQAAKKDMSAARAALQQGLQINPSHIPTLDALLKLEIHEKKFEAALNIAHRLQGQQPSNSLGYEREGDILVSQNHASQAVKTYELALSKGAGADVLIKLHRLLTDIGNLKAAGMHLTHWLKKHPKDVSTRVYAAQFHMEAGHNKEAITQYQEALQLLPNNALLLNNLASLYQREKDPRALATAEEALKLAPDHPAILDTAGWIMLEQGQLSRAVDILGRAAAKAPKVGSVRYHFAVALARTGRKNEARRELQAALAGDKNYPEIEQARALLSSL